MIKIYTLLSTSTSGGGHIPESCYHIDAATANAKRWQHTLKGNILVVSYDARHASLNEAALAGEVRLERTVLSNNEVIIAEEDGSVIKNSMRLGYVFNGLKPTQITLGFA